MPPLDPLPDEIVVRTRDEFRSGFLNAYLTKRPNDSTNEGSLPWIYASAIADQLVAMSFNARVIGRSIPLSEVVGLRLDQRLAEKQLPPRFGERGSSGFVVIATSGGGATLTLGAELSEPDSQSRFAFTGATGTYNTGDAVPVQAITTGPGTNFDEGTVLAWDPPASGLSLNATVQAPGLRGGRVAESDEQVRLRISNAEADPAASGNVASYLRLAENSGAHGVAVGKAFAYPLCNGPASLGLAFVLTPGGPGTSRVPSSAQIALVRAYVLTAPDDPTRVAPEDDSLFDTTVAAQPVSVVLDVRWSQRGANWKDASRWPVRHTTGAGAIVVSSATDATHFSLGRDAGSYSGEPQPAVGQTIALYNKATGKFARKRILSFTGTGPWAITVDTTNDSSDTSYVPIVGQRACPWSESLDDLAKPILDYFDKLGPGEQFSTFFDPGVRQRRNPPSPEHWPSQTTEHLATGVLDLLSVSRAIVQEGLGVAATVGVPGVLVSLLELGDIAAFPL